MSLKKPAVKTISLQRPAPATASEQAIAVDLERYPVGKYTRRNPWRFIQGYKRCRAEGPRGRCRGEIVDWATKRCVAHLDPAAIEDVFRRVSGGAPAPSVRGVRFTKQFLAEFLNAFPADGNGRRTVRSADFSGATFPFAVTLEDLDFRQGVSFAGADFGRLIVTRSSFADSDWTHSIARDGATFTATEFSGKAWFPTAEFPNLRFADCKFKSEANFNAVQVAGDTRFENCEFGDLTYRQPNGGEMTFDKVVFGGIVAFSAPPSPHVLNIVRCEAKQQFTARFEDDKSDVLIQDSTFSGHVQLFADTSRLTLRRNAFLSSAIFESRARRVRIEECIFEEGGQFQYSGRGSVNLVSTSFGDPFLLHGIRGSIGSLRGTDLSSLTVDGLSLKYAAITESFNIDALRVRSVASFDRAPRAFGVGRRILVEERIWRSASRLHFRWKANRKLPRLSDPNDLERLADAYRALRKGLEVGLDSPGAADFYYGEMEARRHSRKRGLSERALLAVYWAVSGYGLRAGRALVALLVVLLVSSAAFMTGGFADPVSPYGAPNQMPGQSNPSSPSAPAVISVSAPGGKSLSPAQIWLSG